MYSFRNKQKVFELKQLLPGVYLRSHKKPPTRNSAKEKFYFSNYGFYLRTHPNSSHAIYSSLVTVTTGPKGEHNSFLPVWRTELNAPATCTRMPVQCRRLGRPSRRNGVLIHERQQEGQLVDNGSSNAKGGPQRIAFMRAERREIFRAAVLRCSTPLPTPL